MNQLIDKVKSYLSVYMSNYDVSHDFQHIRRVVKLAKTIEARERISNPHVQYRSDIITLASMLHDVGDRKYLKPGQDGTIMVQELLLDLGADIELAKEIQAIVNHVSYSSEIKDLGKVQKFLEEYPELGVVQDADRLDAVGATGIGRCFAFEGAVGNHGLTVAIAHFQVKLEKLEKMMKTGTGSEMAAVRTRRLKEFRGWWEDEEKDIADVVV